VVLPLRILIDRIELDVDHVLVFDQVHALHVSNVVLIIMLGSAAHLLLGEEYLLITFGCLWLLIKILRAGALLLQILREFAVLHGLGRLERPLGLLLLLCWSAGRGGHKGVDSMPAVVDGVKVDGVHQLLRLCVFELKVALELIFPVVLLAVGEGPLEHGGWSRTRGVAAHIQLLILKLLRQPAVHFPEAF
jgi:hypothetical protein